MSHKKFGPNDIFINRVKMHPEWDFFIYNSEVYINNSPNISGSLAEGKTYKGVPNGYLSLYEYNINRFEDPTSKLGSKIIPFLEANLDYKTRFRKDLKNMTGETTADSVPFPNLMGTRISSSYEMSASITRQYLAVSQHVVDGPFGVGSEVIESHNHTASVLKNMCLQYRTINPDFSDAVVGELFDRSQTPLFKMFNEGVNMINIPSIFYGSEIKKGTVNLNYYVNGASIAIAKDKNENGQLIGTSGNTSGSVVGYVLYREGILFFPKGEASNRHGAFTALDSGAGIKYDGYDDDARWIYFGHGANEKNNVGSAVTPHATHASASYSINFEGTTYKNTMTMFCHADKAELNYSNNPTFLNLLQSGSISNFTSGSYVYSDAEVDIKNVASSSFHKGEDDFRKVTYVSKVGIYDENDNLLMTVDLARPYKKEEKDNYTFKIKYDLL